MKFEASIPEIIFETIEKHPEKTAVITDTTKFSYKDLSKKLAGTIVLFKEYKVQKDNTIALLIPNSIEFLVSTLAAAFLGAKVFPLNPNFSYPQIVSLLERYNIDYLITTNQFKYIDVKGIKKILLDLKEIGNEELKLDLKISPDTPFLITTTSGSTGTPKPLVMSQKTKIKRAFLSAINLYNLSDKDSIVVSTPMYHSLGFRLSLLPLFLGGTGIILKHFTPQNWIKSVIENNISFSILVSNQIEMILDYIERNNITFSNFPLKKLVSSSFLLAENTKEKLLNLLNCEIHEIYGTSETGTATNICFNKENKIGSVGKPLSYVDIKIYNKNKEGIGEIGIKTETIFDFYLDIDKKSSFTKDGYFLTGDLGYIDEEGYLYYKGRKKYVIKVGAINVYPEDIEEVIDKFPNIKKSIAIGIKDKIYGNRIILFFEKVDKEKQIDLKELRKFCYEKLATYQVPYEFVEVKSIPRNPIGKIDRNILVKFYEEHKNGKI